VSEGGIEHLGGQRAPRRPRLGRRIGRRQRSVIRTQPMSTERAPVTFGALAVQVPTPARWSRRDVGEPRTAVVGVEVTDPPGERQPRLLVAADHSAGSPSSSRVM